MLTILTIVGLMAAGCDQWPHDPERTLAQVQGSELRVGIVENPPWTRYDNGVVSGVEVSLIEQFADEELDAEVVWVRGGESDLMPALERYELHLLIGGLTSDSPWKSRVGFSRPYFTNRFLVGSSASQPMETIAGERVAVAVDQPMLIALAREQGAEVVPVTNLRDAETDILVAPAWQFELLDRQRSHIELHRVKHVMAVPAGENGWIMRLDRFLHREADSVADRLRREEALSP